MSDAPPADDQPRLQVLDSIARVETLLRNEQRSERAGRWITLTSTVVSTVLISGLTAFTSYQLKQQEHTLQQAVAAQGQIHDLSSEDANVRYGAQRFLAGTTYADLVIRQATEFGDVDSIRALGADASDATTRQQYGNAEAVLMREMEEDRQCFAGQWEQNDVDKGVLRSFTVQVVGPRRLSVYRGGPDGGLYVRARKIGKNLWVDADFSYGTNRGKLQLTTDDDCSFLDSNWGWHIQKKVVSASAASSTSVNPSSGRPRR